VRVPAVPYTVTTRGVVYVPLPTVSAGAGPEVEAALRSAERSGARGVVLDLRGNAGGAVDQAIHVASALVEPGAPVLDIRERGGRVVVPAFLPGGAATAPVRLPVVVLQDGRSASAAEIIAGALQDNGRARVVGDTSYGKGLAQTLFPLAGGYALKLTTARWYTPAGRSIHRDRPAGAPAARGGIAPDLVVRPDTLAGAPRAVAAALGRRPEAAGRALAVAAYGLARGVRTPAEVRAGAAWRQTLRDALVREGVAVDAAAWDAAAPWVARLLEREVADFAFGPAAARARDLAADRQYQAADSLLRAARPA
jgi:carboxyl-terminal processing protease